MGNTTIKLRVKKEIDNSSEQKIIKLKGSIIAGGFTEIIHISDENEEFYLNSFSINPDARKPAESFVSDYIQTHELNDLVSLV